MNKSSWCLFLAILPPASPRHMLLGAGIWESMDQQHSIAAVLFSGCFVSPVFAEERSHAASLGDALNVAGEAVASGYRAAPALMLGLAMLLAIPLIALASRIWVWSQRSSESTRRFRRRIKLFEQDVSAEISGETPQLPGHAYLEVVGSRSARFTILRDMLRIGREEDNDIRIPSGAVHRYHAAIHRVDVGAYRITDLSGIEGNGVVVNGQPCADARLYDGDMIELGPGRLRFHAGLL